MPGLSRRNLVVGLVAGIALVAVLVAVSLVGAGGGGSDSAGPVAGGDEVASLLGGIPQDGLALGDPNAPVTLVEFADLQCPFCAEWARESFPPLVRDYVRTGRVRFVFRGIAFIGPDSEKGLRAVYAASGQDRLWQLTELLYRNQGEENSGWLTDDRLRDIAGAVDGLDVDALVDAMDSAAVDRDVAAATTLAGQHRVDQTPTFLVGPTGGKLDKLQLSSLGPGDFRAAFDSLLR